MLIVVSVFVVFFLIILGVMLLISPGKPQPYLDQAGRPLAGSISEKVFIDVNGTRQGMFIKGKDIRRPVLLYLHGGMPDYFLDDKYPAGLEDLFTVVWWEQRGSGLSYSASIPRETMTMEQLISDTLTVTNYLRGRFSQEKIYLIGHSGGTFTGIQAVARAPELYDAYIGEAQMSYQLKSEKLAYDYMLASYKEIGNQEMVSKLEAAPVTMTGGTPHEYVALRDPAMHSLGIGTMRGIDSVVTGIFLPSLASRDYTLMEKVNLWRGKAAAGVSLVWDDMLATDLAEKAPEIGVPVYFLHGVYDYTCSYTEAKAYFVKLKAPVKGFYTFESSAHSPIFEEPEKVRKIMRDDVLAGTNRLADAE